MKTNAVTRMMTNPLMLLITSATVILSLVIGLGLGRSPRIVETFINGAGKFVLFAAGGIAVLLLLTKIAALFPALRIRANSFVGTMATLAALFGGIGFVTSLVLGSIYSLVA